ncbi:MAG: hypothetical protein ABI811_16160 [Acidobacteriota bacterium]
MTPQWQSYREPLRSTILRTGLIALVVGGVIAGLRSGWARWLVATLLVLWPSFGGHWVEVWFLNWLRPRIAVGRSVQVAARLVVWFIGGICLAIGMRLTAGALDGFERVRWPAWWIAGLGFIGIELVAHLFLELRGRPSVYNGRG